ncbi:MAG: dipeptidase [Bacilli bacterium]|nr:dipeptidase [Bacilli bacterium]
MKIIDMHCDTIMALMNSNEELRKSNNMIDLEKLKKGDYLLQCFAMFVPYVSRKEDENYSPFEYCHKMIDKYYQELEKNQDLIAAAYTYEDIEKNIASGKITALLTIEEGGVCLGNIEFLRNFYRLGVRMMTLTWNFKNEIATPNIDYFSVSWEKIKEEGFKPNTTDGLTEFGIEVVKEMNRLGMVIDCSHLGDKGFYDVIKYSTKPIVCSHSCSRTICNHVRNMTDDMLLKLKMNGGVVGINYCHDFIKEDNSFSTVKDVVKHIVYIKNLIGIDYIGLGSDFDGIGNSDIELKDASLMGLLLDELRNQGFSEEDIDKICYKNVLRVFKANFNK